MISVGATTEHGCVAKYSNAAPQLDLVAPGGGPDADVRGDPNCRRSPAGARHLPDHLHPRPAHVRPPGRLRGHLDGRAARLGDRRARDRLGRAGADPTPADIRDRLLATARDLGPPGPDNRYGAGLVDAAAPRPAPAVIARAVRRDGAASTLPPVRGIWLWMQVVIVLCVLASAVIAVVKLYL